MHKIAKGARVVGLHKFEETFQWQHAKGLNTHFHNFEEETNNCLKNRIFNLKTKNYKKVLLRQVSAELNPGEFDWKRLLGPEKIKGESFICRSKSTFFQILIVIRNPIFNLRDMRNYFLVIQFLNLYKKSLIIEYYQFSRKRRRKFFCSRHTFGRDKKNFER